MNAKKRFFELVRRAKDNSKAKSKPKKINKTTQIKHEIRDHMPSFIKKILKIDHHIPLGINILILFSGLMGVLYLLFSTLFSFTITFGMVIEGAIARLLNIIMIILISFMIFGFAKKRMWSYNLANIMFSFIILNSIISMFFIKKSVSGTLILFVTFSFFFLIMMNVITLWYVRHMKNYFMHKYHPPFISNEDKTYISSLAFLWLVFIFVSGILVSSYYEETTQKLDKIILELQNTHPQYVDSVCSFKQDDRDLCLLTGAIIYENELNTINICKMINSYFYRYACFSAIQGDSI